MKKFISKIFLLFALPGYAIAGLSNCEDVYVGTISTDKSGGTTVVFLEHALNSSGSYALNFSGWSADAKKEAISLLLSAQMVGRKVSLKTEAADECSITSAWQTVKQVHMSNK